MKEDKSFSVSEGRGYFFLSGIYHTCRENIWAKELEFSGCVRLFKDFITRETFTTPKLAMDTLKEMLLLRGTIRNGMNSRKIQYHIPNHKIPFNLGIHSRLAPKQPIQSIIFIRILPNPHQYLQRLPLLRNRPLQRAQLRPKT